MLMQRRIEGTAHAAVIDALTAISRTRPLTPSESRRLEEALHQSERKGQRIWTRGDDRRLLRLLERGKRPRHIAPILGRTERAVWRRMYRLGLAVRVVAKSSIDGSGGK